MYLYLLATWVLILTGYLNLTEARGPHHPPGQPVKRHVHYTPGTTAKQILQDEELIHDIAHLEEHLVEQKIETKPDLSKMTDEELDLYYFLLHDFDKNSKLDGLELLQAIEDTTHDHKEEDDQINFKNGNEDNVAKAKDFNRFVELVDQLLEDNDKNQDGFLSFAEYIDARRTVQKEVPSVELV